jgi:pimeloyl-ACP methyl ester carboxylesterase
MAAMGYDEFGFLHENAEEFGLPFERPPVVSREEVELDDGRRLSTLRWGVGDPQLVFLHGGAQNAHTWDTVALALRRPLLAIDLPGHGHSDGGKEGSLALADNASDVASAMRQLAPNARALVGMSLGGLTGISLGSLAPDLVERLVLVDITPGVNAEKSAEIMAFVQGPESFASFDEILARTIKFNPTRTEASLRRGVLHNAVQGPDGRWVWRYQRFASGGRAPFRDFESLWQSLSDSKAPLMLVRGMRPQSVVDDSDEARLLEVRPDARIEHVEHAGHSVQGDAPLELAKLIDDFAP